MANDWNINDKVVLLVIKMIKESKSCSSTMDYVPLPIGPQANVLKKVLTNEVKQILKGLSDDRAKVACLNSLKAKYRSDFEMIVH